jgi:Tfp pilus assembly protein PilF
MEAVGKLDEAQVAYRAAAQRWPEEALPQLGLANIAATRGDLGAAEQGYREALRRDPQNVPARNNLAEVLLQLGCPEAASSQVAAARQIAGTGPLAASVEATASRIARHGGPDPAGCPAR